jgi:hypothetical protein
MSNEEKQATTVFIEGQSPKVASNRVKVSSPYEKDAVTSFTEDCDASITRHQEREHRLQCLKMATSWAGHGDPRENPYEVVKFAKRFWQFVREGK